MIVAVVLGFSTGAAVLIMPMLGMDRSLTWITHSQSHGVIQLFGWAGLFVMGFAFHVVPRFFNGHLRNPLPQKLVLWFVLGGMILRFTGQSVYKTSAADPLVAIGGFFLFAGTLVFGWAMFEVIRSSPRKTGQAEMWVWGGITWSMIAGALHFAVTLKMAIDSAPLAHAPWNEALIYAAMFGFITSFVFGVTVRALRGILLLKPMYERVNVAAFWLLQAGLATLVVGHFVDASQEVISAGFILSSAGLVTFVFAVRALESPVSSAMRFPVGHPWFPQFVRVAYGWLAVGAVMLALESLEKTGAIDLLPPPISLPIMHVFTLGFITLIIVGVASKFFPIFEGADIKHPRLIAASFVLINVSVLIRVAFGFTTGDLAESMLGISGGVGFIGICLFAVVVFQLMTVSARAAYNERASTFGQIKFDAAKQAGRIKLK